MVALDLGVDIGGTHLRAMGRDACGARTRIIEMPVPRTPEAVVDAIAAAGRELADGGLVGSVAVGLSGQTLPDVPVWIPALRFLDGFPLADGVRADLGGNCVLLNDAQATLMAEAHEGAAVGYATVALVTIGTGIGGAIQVGGTLVAGRNGCAGAFGWLPMGEVYPHADHGQWEQLASGAALDSRAARWGGTAGLIEAARATDADALAELTAVGTLIGRGVAGIASILDPDLIVFAGGLRQAYDLFEAPIIGALGEYGSPAGKTTPLVAAKLGHTAGVVGALLAAIQADSTHQDTRKTQVSG